MRCLGLPARPVFTLREVPALRFRRIWVANEFDAEGFIHPAFLPDIRALPGPVGIPGHRLYVSRLLSTNYRPTYRVMTNEAEVEALARRRGFQVVYPETLDFVEQARLFAGAAAIIGPSGSGMLNAIFAPAGAKVATLESFNFTVRQHAKINVSTGKRYSYAFGRAVPGDLSPPPFRNWSIPLDRVERLFDWLDTPG